MIAPGALAPPPRTEGGSIVDCLRCGVTYSKPSAGGMYARNPGCPACSYLGWMPGRSVDPTAAIRDPHAAETRGGSRATVLSVLSDAGSASRRITSGMGNLSLRPHRCKGSAATRPL